MEEYVIAIPSYKRHAILKKKTLAILGEYKIPKQKIFIFVANKQEYDIYSQTLDNKTYNKLIIGKKGIKQIRNFMANYFDEGQHIVYMDDDIGKIWECVNTDKPYKKENNKVIKLKSLDKFIKKAFKLSKKIGFHNWGVYPRDNPYFMKPSNFKAKKSKKSKKSTNLEKSDKKQSTKTPMVPNCVSTDLKFLIGFLTGVINNRNAEKRTIGDKEDYERTIKYFIKDGGVLRFNNISCYTRCYKTPGGIQADRKKHLSEKNANILIKKYPKLVSINNSRNSDYVEIILRDKRDKN